VVGQQGPDLLPKQVKKDDKKDNTLGFKAQGNDLSKEKAKSNYRSRAERSSKIHREKEHQSSQSNLFGLHRIGLICIRFLRQGQGYACQSNYTDLISSRSET
jgi:hypothetical protein